MLLILMITQQIRLHLATYYVDIVATDTSGNEGVATLTIQVIDDVCTNILWTNDHHKKIQVKH